MLECLTQGRGAAGFESHRCHWVVSLSKTHLSLLSAGSTQEIHPDITEKLLTGTYRIKSNKIIHKMIVRIANREDPDQTASEEAVWSESALFV